MYEHDLLNPLIFNSYHAAGVRAVQEVKSDFVRLGKRDPARLPDLYTALPPRVSFYLHL